MVDSPVYVRIMYMRKGYALVLVILVILFLVGGTAYFLIKKSNGLPDGDLSKTVDVTTSLPQASNQNWIVYKNEEYKFTLSYPPDWQYKINDPYIPALAEFTVIFHSPTGNALVDVWIRDGEWEQVEQEALKDPKSYKGQLAGQSVVIQPVGDTEGTGTLVKHPTLPGKILVISTGYGDPIRDEINSLNQIRASLKFE